MGVELGGALKNVIAIAAGIVSGLGHGHNTVAALITRGLAEITRLAVARGARPETLAACALAERTGVDMPITQQMRAVLYEGKAPGEAVDELMLRSLKRE